MLKAKQVEFRSEVPKEAKMFRKCSETLWFGVVHELHGTTRRPEICISGSASLRPKRLEREACAARYGRRGK